MSETDAPSPATPASPPLPAMPLDALAIRAILPHRYPFLMLDRVTAIEQGKTITALKCVTQNEPFFQGHFPQKPIMPGVLQIEAIAQAGAILLMLSTNIEGKIAALTNVEDFRFRRPVVPGDVLTVEILEMKIRRLFGRARGQITIGGELVCNGQIGFGLIDPV